MFDSDLRLQTVQTEKIDFILSALVRACDAEAALLVSGSGQEMAGKGNLADFDRAAVASLSAGTLAAMAELAGVFGEPDFTGAAHRGKERTILLRPVGRKALLVVMAGNSRVTPRLGHTLARAVPLLTDILEPSSDDPGQTASRERVYQAVD